MSADKNPDILDRQLTELPEETRFCTRCVTSNQRPRITFDDEGVCSACRYAEEKETAIDWAEREAMLVDLLDKHRSGDGSYDVLVPSSGGKDSCLVAHQLKHRYGMHPLTVTYAPFLYTDIGWRNYNNFVHGGFDNLLFNPDGKLYRKLARVSFELLGDAWHPFGIGQKTYAFHMALRFGIPLVFYGENGEAEYGGNIKNKNKPYESVEDWNELYFKGAGVDSLIEPGLDMGIFRRDEVTDNSFPMLRQPPLEAIERLGVEMHWFSFYTKWVPQENYYYAVEHFGFEANPEGRSEGTHSKYASLDDKTDGFHWYLGYIKFGMGRTTRDASMEVRHRHLLREEAMALVRRYDGEFPSRYFRDFLEYIDISEEHFWHVVDRYRLPHIWTKVNDEWRLRHTVWGGGVDD